MIEYLKAVLFGIIEGITEWLPVSSTGHMILLDEFVKLKVSEEFYEMFQVVIQLGAIMAVVLLFWRKIFPLGKNEKGIFIKKDIMSLWGKIIVACVPAAVIGLLFDDVFEALFYNYQSVSVALIVFGVAFILVEAFGNKNGKRVTSVDELSYTLALAIGVFQLIAAVFPGTSRSGATIVGALLLGVSRVVAAEFTFYLAIPVMFGASLLKVLKFGFTFTATEIAILAIGMITAFAVSLIVIKFLMGYIKKHDFKVFGWYRIILGILVIVYFGAIAR
jgi:undecaprenyl-diphosphatase